MRSTRLLATIATLAFAAMPAHSMQGVSQTIRLRAYVPMICNVQLQQSFAGMPSADGIVNLGTTQEFCNAPRGYRVILQHPADLADAAAVSDARRIPLSASGETVLVNSDHPDFRLRNLALDLGEDPAQVNRLGLRIEVKY